MKQGTGNIEIWEQRWQGLDLAMQQMIELVRSDTHVARQSTLLSLLESLRAFGDSQMSFFLEGARPGSPLQLEPSPDYPWEYVFRTTLNQIGHDLDVMQRAYHQRQPGPHKERLLDTLRKADLLAYRALEPAIKLGLLENTTVVTYFQKSTVVRIIPYAPTAFIGLPVSSVTSSRDLLAIPHEVGHYVYRHGRMCGGKYRGSRFNAALADQFAHQPLWLQNWLEEIFADIYSALIAGPVVALSFQEIVTDSPLADFLVDDGEHPIPALRPSIHTDTLDLMRYFAQAVPMLRESWQHRLDARRNPQTFSVGDPATKQVQELSIAKTSQLIKDEIIKPLIDAHLEYVAPTGKPYEGIWSRDLSRNVQVESLYNAFDDFATKVMNSGETTPEFTLITDENRQRWLHLDPRDPNSGIAASQRKVGATGLWVDAIKAAVQAKQKFNVPPDVWMALLDGSGWATEGPGANTH